MSTDRIVYIITTRHDGVVAATGSARKAVKAALSHIDGEATAVSFALEEGHEKVEPTYKALVAATIKFANNWTGFSVSLEEKAGGRDANEVNIQVMHLL
tara:strand:- start:1687 stop:1983 length:297 start_codon:yes stop_codon:yes gene_type:complete